MKKAIVGKKVGMTQVFTRGRTSSSPSPSSKPAPAPSCRRRPWRRDGYDAVQVGFDETLTESRAKKLVNKPEARPLQKGWRGRHCR